MFLTIFANEDRLKGTSHTKLIQEIYSNPIVEDKLEYLKSLNISTSTFQRYREKYAYTLKLTIDVQTSGVFLKKRKV